MMIDDIEVDMESICSIDYQCVKDGCTVSTCCCSMYEVYADNAEMLTITGYFGEASKLSGHLRKKDGFANVFDEEDEYGLHAIDKANDGLCVFAYKKDGRIRCSLHSVALGLNIPPHKMKPEACTLWPVLLKGGRPLKLSIHEDAFSFGCNVRLPAPRPSICPHISDIIENIFSVGFKMKLEKMAKKMYK